jgi:glucosamine--fructose-6-phosphate aminotransferase (isomerizing)
MLKEIYEQPRVVADTLAGYDAIAEKVKELINLKYRGLESILIIACGTSYYSALLGKYAMEELLGIPVRVELASELNYFSSVIMPAAAIAVSQSGETADTIQAARKIKAAGCKLIAITNVPGSQLGRLADFTILTKAGPEMSVASTKTFAAQVSVLYSLALSLSRKDTVLKNRLLAGLKQTPVFIQRILSDTSVIEETGRYLAGFSNALYVSRGVNYPVALAGALKLKEESYIHGEGYAAGELKHGPFALLDVKTPVIAIVVRDSTYNPMLTNIREIKTRKAPIIALVEEGDRDVGSMVDMVIEIPRGVDAFLSPVVNAVALQLMAYYTARSRGCSIDFPRNLAKTVTVE